MSTSVGAESELVAFSPEPLAQTCPAFMAVYQYSTHLFRAKDPAFSRELEPGELVPLAGIFRCIGCGREVAIEKDTPLPNLAHHPHSVEQGSMRWKLLVFADPREK